MGKNLITERTINEAHRNGCRVLHIGHRDVVTPAARDRARQLNIELTTAPPEKKESPAATGASIEAPNGGRIAIGSDHGGFEMKVTIKKYCEELGYDVYDLGTYSADSCDYPDFAYAVAYAVSRGEAWRGIMIDGAGIGSAMAANKVPGIRAALCYNEFTARNAREHNDANVLTLGSRSTGIDVAKSIVKIFLESWFGGGRHKKRVDKINDIEKRFIR